MQTSFAVLSARLKSMAIYHCCIKTVSRSDGRSATGAAAYRSGSCIVDERTGEIHDYTRKHGVEHSELVQPEGVNLTREELWNGAENAEKRKNSTVAREYEVALPDELNAEQRKALALDFARHLVNEYGVAADVAIHAPGKRATSGTTMPTFSRRRDKLPWLDSGTRPGAWTTGRAGGRPGSGGVGVIDQPCS